MKNKIPPLNEQGFMENWRDLKLSHRQTYWMLKKYLKRIESIVKDADGNHYQHPDIKMIKGAMSDNSYAVRYLHLSGNPNRKHGIEHKKAYVKKKVYMDPQLMEALIQKQKPPTESKLTDDQRFKIEDALSRLSCRERECYELRYGDLFELHEIAEHLNISLGSVQVYLTRAEHKIAEDLGSSLFLQI